MKKYLALLVVLCVSVFVNAQGICPQYPWVKDSLNYFGNDSSLYPFYKKLDELKSGERKTVTVVQIGDSHIQADYFSGYIRQQLQKQFGNEGRGMIFPYRVAGSNGPVDYHTNSNCEWNAKRNVFPDKPMESGVGAFTINAIDTGCHISIQLDDDDSLNYAFNQFSIFADTGSTAFDIEVWDESDSVLLGKMNMQHPLQPYYNSVMLHDTVHSIYLHFTAKDSTQNHITIYGMYVSNNMPGVLFDMIGSNGAKYDHYNQSTLFAQQLSVLNADLIIVSLGTNDAYNKYYNDADFETQVSEFISTLQTTNPGCSFLITGPPDGYRYKKYKNPCVVLATNVLKNYAAGHQCASWDFYHIMGGYGSIYKWYKYGLAQRDWIHLTRKGYELQGQLFMNAFEKSYQHYELAQHH